MSSLESKNNNSILRYSSVNDICTRMSCLCSIFIPSAIASDILFAKSRNSENDVNGCAGCCNSSTARGPTSASKHKSKIVLEKIEFH